MTSPAFDYVPDEDPTIQDAIWDFMSMRPIRIPGGWVILTGVGYETLRKQTLLSCSTVFVPDPEHKLDWENWEGP